MKRLAAALAALLMAAGPASLLLAPLAALAQGSPNFTNGQVPTAGQWNGAFAAKLDYNPGSPNSLLYWGSGGVQRSALVSGDCSAAASVFTCRTLNGLAPGNLFPLNAGAGLTISGSSLNTSNPVPSNLTLTNPASPATFTLLGGKTFTVNNTLTLSGTDASTLAIGAGGTLRAAAFLGLGTGLTTSGTNAILANPSPTTLGGIESYASVTHQWINAISTLGVPSSTQPAFSDISGLVSATQLPNPSASTLGGIESYAAVSHQWINTISTSGVPASTQPAFSDISGTAAAAQLPLATAAAVGGVQGDGSTLTITAGVIKCTTGSAGQLGCLKPDGTTISASGGTLSVVSGVSGSSLVSTQTASSSATLQWTGLGASNTSYLLVIQDLVLATNNTNLLLQFGHGAGPTWTTSGYIWNSIKLVGSIVQTSSVSDTGIDITSNQSVSNTNTLSGYVYLHAIPSTSTPVTAEFTMHSATSTESLFQGGANLPSTGSATTGIRLEAVTGNITSGTASLFTLSN